MNYTVISKSGWVNDQWKVMKTFHNKKEAGEYAKTLRQSDAKREAYRVEVRAHRRELSELMNHDADCVRFSDGTRALW